MGDLEEPVKRKLVIFGLDFSKDPCARNSLIYGISSGLVAGIVYNIFWRKNPFNLAMVGFGVALFGSYLPCKYIQYKNEKFKKDLEPFLSNYARMSDEEKARLDNEWASLAMLNNRTNVRNFRSDADSEEQKQDPKSSG